MRKILYVKGEDEQGEKEKEKRDRNTPQCPLPPPSLHSSPYSQPQADCVPTDTITLSRTPTTQEVQSQNVYVEN